MVLVVQSIGGQPSNFLLMLAVQRSLLPHDRMVVSAQNIVISCVVWSGHCVRGLKRFVVMVGLALA